MRIDRGTQQRCYSLIRRIAKEPDHPQRPVWVRMAARAVAAGMFHEDFGGAPTRPRAVARALARTTRHWAPPETTAPQCEYDKRPCSRAPRYRVVVVKRGLCLDCCQAHALTVLDRLRTAGDTVTFSHRSGTPHVHA